MSPLSFLMTPRQQRILSLALLLPDVYLSLSDFLETAGPGHGATQRYLKQLVAESILLVDKDVRQPRYIVNTGHAFYPELYALMAKAAGMA